MYSHILIAVLCLTAAGPANEPGMPIPVNKADSATQRWLAKPVHAKRLLDDMESLANWHQRSNYGYASPSELIGTMTLTEERFRDGNHSIRLQSPTKLDRPGPQLGRPFGTTTSVRDFDREDWSDYNRVSFWVYPDLPGFHSVSLLVQLRNEGELTLPGPGRLGMNFLNLDNHRWNHVAWEIPDLPRDCITAIEFQYRLQGNENGAARTVSFDFDQLELQRVDADYYEGWGVAPDRIAYSHSGYRPQSPKVAFACAGESGQFELIDAQSDEVVFTKSVEHLATSLGRFTALDFTELNHPGTYVLRVGETSTRPFGIAEDAWIPSTWKAVNYFYCQRCGDAIDGIHDVCHQDWQGVHNDTTIIINGGWHDAGDACQGLKNSCEAIGAMLALADQLRQDGDQHELANRLIEEARWGLQYVLKNNFGDGYRVAWATHDYWTNGEIGDADDVVVTARNGPRENFAAAVAETTAFRVLREEDPEFARECLQAAESDWSFATQAIQSADGEVLTDVSGVGSDTLLDLAAIGTLASIELYQTTGQSQYADLAVELAATVVDCQHRTNLQGVRIPLSGFFHPSPDSTEIYHSHHRGHVHTPIMAMAAMCHALPDHPDWIRWYACVAYHSEYLKTVAAYTEPYGVLPASLYRDDEYLQIPEEAPRGRFAGYAGPTRESFRQQVLHGHDMGGGYFLRRFPVWFMIRGHFGVLLTKTKALSTAARLRNDPEAERLAERQLQWIVGCNPFAQSTMIGEGHDFVPHYSALSGQIVGSLPVGIETLLDHDAPYWSVHNHMNSKETWVYPVAHWMSVLTDLSVPRRGRIVGGKQFSLDAAFSRQGREVQIGVTIRGQGRHDLSIRGDNIHFETARTSVNLNDGTPRRMTWRGTIESIDAPWVAVVIPNGAKDLSKDVVSFASGQDDDALDIQP